MLEPVGWAVPTKCVRMVGTAHPTAGQPKDNALENNWLKQLDTEVDWAKPERRHPDGKWLPASCRRSAGPCPTV